jgi:methylated-DNA-[protein]-cysteine S-methyltransferase
MTTIKTATIYFTTVETPIGRLALAGDGAALSAISFAPAPGHWTRDDARLGAARRQLEQYFAGRRTTFDLPLALDGTPFQKRVWRALLAIPYGATASYGEIARAIGAPGAARAVGGANHVNPIPIIVPCHRVIGADGSLTGYGGGEHRKRHLLDLERRHAEWTSAVPVVP